MLNRQSLKILSILLLLSVSVMARTTGTINGFVRNADDGEPLAYANVFLRDTNLGAMSNEKGYYVIHHIPPGEYTLVFSMIGFEREEKKVTIRANQNTTVNAQLRINVIEMNAIVKTASRERFEREVEISTTSLNARQLISLPMLAEADLFRTLQLLPGVVSRSDFSSQLYVRGGSPDQNLILLDGVTVYNPFHLGGVFSTFNVDAIKNVEFMTGGFPAEYGGRLSSVLKITNREGNSKRFQGTANISLLSAKSTVEGPIPRGSYLLAARRTYFDQLFKGTKYDFPYYFYDLQGKTNLDLNTAHRITLSGFWGDDVLDFSVDEEDVSVNLDWLWGNRTSSLNWRWIIKPQLYSELLLTRGRFRNDLDLTIAGTSRAALVIHNSITDYTLKGDFTYFGISGHEIKFGGIRSWLDFKYRIKINEIELFNYHEMPGITSIYTQDQWQIGKKTSIRLGGRVDYYNMGSRWRVSPNIALKYRRWENVALKVSWGVYHQYLTTASSDEQNFSFMDLWFPLTKSYLPLSATHYVAGLEWWLPYDVVLTAELYYKELANLLELNENGDFADKSDDFFVGNGFARGAEILLRKSVGRLTGWLGYSLALTKRDINHVVYYPKQDRRHSLNLVLNFDLGRGWTLGTVFSYGSGTPFTPVLGKMAHYEWDFNDNELNEDIYNIRGPKNSARYPAYHRMDVSIRKKWKLFGLKNTPYLQIVNVYNQKNVFFYFWDHDSNPSKLVTITMFPFLPTLGIEFDF